MTKPKQWMAFPTSRGFRYRARSGRCLAEVSAHWGGPINSRSKPDVSWSTSVSAGALAEAGGAVGKQLGAGTAKSVAAAKKASLKACKRGATLGALVDMSKPFYDRPVAAAGLKSYRARGSFGWIMIGATDDKDAYREALRSSAHVKREDLQVWNGTEYVPVT